VKRAQPLVRSCHAAQPEGLRGVSSHAFSVRNLVSLREPGVSRFALTPGYPPCTPSGCLMPWLRRAIAWLKISTCCGKPPAQSHAERCNCAQFPYSL